MPISLSVISQVLPSLATSHLLDHSLSFESQRLALLLLFIVLQFVPLSHRVIDALFPVVLFPF